MKALMTSGMLLLSLTAFAQDESPGQPQEGRVEIRESGGRHAPSARVSFKPEQLLLEKRFEPGTEAFAQGEPSGRCSLSNATLTVSSRSEIQEGLRIRERHVITHHDAHFVGESFSSLYASITAAAAGEIVAKAIRWDESLPVTTYVAFYQGKEIPLLKLVDGEEASANASAAAKELIETLDSICQPRFQ